MVESRLRRWLWFAAFVLPAAVAYGLFFVNPFLQGIRISFTNWDGLTPRAPISLPRGEFEARILERASDPGDREMLLRVYSLDAAEGVYRRYELTGAAKRRIHRILRKVGYEPATYRFVGLANFVDIFTGSVDERFYPHSFVRHNYNPDSSLPASAPREEWERNFLPHLSAAERAEVLRHYSLAEDRYVLEPEYDEFVLEDAIWLLPEVDKARTVPPAAVDALVAAIRVAGLRGERGALEASVAAFVREHALGPESARVVRAAAERLFELGALKRLLADRWVERRFEMGVVGFTLFFALGNVIGSNLLGFLLALALDSGVRMRNLLRTVFFLPNVLSMVVVALVWSFVFFNLLPALTGIEKWMGDPAKAPWLLVLVQVWQQSGYLMVIYLAGLQNVPTEVQEAALIDGTSYWQRLGRVILPLLAPAFTISLFLSLSNSLKCFDLVYAMVGPSGYATGTVPFVMDIFFDAFAKRMAGLATAKAMLLFFVILAVTGVQLAIMKRREVQL